MAEEVTVYGIKVLRDGNYNFTYTDLFWLIEDARKLIKSLKENPLWETYQFEVTYFHLPMKDE